MTETKSKLAALIKSPSGNIWMQIFRYLVSGGLAFCIDAGILYALTEWLGLYYMVSSTISFSTGLVVTYIMSIIWVFDYRREKKQWREFLIFILIGMVGLGLTSLCMWIFTTEIGMHYMFSKIVTTIIVFVWNFIAKKFLLFSPKATSTKTTSTTPTTPKTTSNKSTSTTATTPQSTTPKTLQDNE